MDLDTTADFLEEIRTTRQAKRRSTPKAPPKEPENNGTNISLVCWRLNFKRHAGGANGQQPRGLFPDVSLCVEGVRIDDGNHWASSEIVERVGPRLVRTTNTAYHLIGKMEGRISSERGFPKEVIEQFACGFPDDWHAILSEFVAFGKNQYESRRELFQSQLQERPPAETTQRRSPRKRRASPQNNNQTPAKRRSQQAADEFLTSDDSDRQPEAADEAAERTPRLLAELPDDDDASFDVAWPSNVSFPETEPEENGEEQEDDQQEEVPQTPPPAPIRSAATETPSANTRAARRRRAEERSGRMDSTADTRTPSPPPVASSRKRKGRRADVRDSDFFQPATPVLNRSRSGRLLKPRLAAGERIVYNAAGSPIAVRQPTTRTHLTNASSQNLNAIAKQLDLRKPETPKQRERRLEAVRPAPKKAAKRSSRTALERLLAYESDEDANSTANRTAGRSDAELTPLPVRPPKAPVGRRRVMFSDDEDDEEEQQEEEEEVVERKTRKTKRQNTTSASTRSKKGGRTAANRTKASGRTGSKAANRNGARALHPPPSFRRQGGGHDDDTTRTPKGRRKSANTSEVTEADESAEPVEEAPPKPKEKKWGKREKEDLQTAFRLYNPLEDSDWRDLIACLPLDWTVEEVKAQAAAMKLRPNRPATQKKAAQSTQLVDRFKKILANGKLPAKGTIRREQLEDAMAELLMQMDTKEDANDSFGQMEDSFFEEAIRAHALDDSLRVLPSQRIVTPSKRTFFPKVVSACRRRSSLAAIDAVGDDFSMPDRSKMVRYRQQHRAQQFNRRYGGTQRAYDPEREVFDDEQEENEASGFSRIEEEDEVADDSLEERVPTPRVNSRLPLPPPPSRPPPVDADATLDREMIDAMFD
ncbi:hypothetical protein M3Y99_01717800 [Aphelenchoides fujianensis]|nr:hypothetical protein M3Y99_01717800 [Aphelenchoides fujianensis]